MCAHVCVYVCVCVCIYVCIFVCLCLCVYALIRNCIEPEIEKILRKNQNGFRRNRSTTSQILTIRRNLKGICAKNLNTTICCIAMNTIHTHIHAETYSTQYDERRQFFRKIYLSLYLKGFERVTKGFTVWEVSWRPNRTATYWPPLLWP